MPPLESLNAVGQCFELQSTDAWKLFENEEFEAANTLVRGTAPACQNM